MSDITCKVFEIIRGTTHDGPGMRTTVFLSGCPLNCLWCQNPEGINDKLDITWDAGKCINCHSCIKICKNRCISEEEEGLVRDKNSCNLCGLCVEACPSKALEFTYKEWGLDALLKEVLKDFDYYQAFNGGVTVSGGEPLSQYKFVKLFFKELKKHKVHTALDTCGFAPEEVFNSLLPFTDLVLFDIKFINETLHKIYTGKSNTLILQNLLSLSHEIQKRNSDNINPSQEKKLNNSIKLWIRTPLIPGVTATAENLNEIAAFINDKLYDVVDRWELCTFNKACINKYDKLNWEWQFKDTLTMEQETVDKLKEAALSNGFNEDKLVVSGLVKV